MVDRPGKWALRQYGTKTHGGALPTRLHRRDTNVPGALVSMEDTVKGFAEILDGKWDDVPEGNFYMKAGIDAVERD